MNDTEDRNDYGNGICPDCGTMYESHTEATEDHKILTVFICPACGSTEEEI